MDAAIPTATLLLAAGAIAVAACNDHPSTGSRDSAREPRPLGEVRDDAEFTCSNGRQADHTDNFICTASAHPREIGLRRCEPDPQRGGGYEVWIRNVRCPEMRRLLRRFGGAAGSRGRPGFFRNEYGFVCWSHPEGRYGPIHNICFRGRQVVLYYIG